MRFAERSQIRPREPQVRRFSYRFDVVDFRCCSVAVVNTTMRMRLQIGTANTSPVAIVTALRGAWPGSIDRLHALFAAPGTAIALRAFRYGEAAGAYYVRHNESYCERAAG